MILTMICMMPNWNLGVGETGFLFCDLYVSLNNPLPGDINSTNLPCLTSVLPGDTSDSRNHSLLIQCISNLIQSTRSFELFTMLLKHIFVR